MKLARFDDKADPKESVRIFDEQLAKKKLLRPFFTCNTLATLALMPLVEQARIPMFAMPHGAIEVANPPKRHVFTMRASFQDEAAYLIRLFHTFGVRRIGFVVSADAFGRSRSGPAMRSSDDGTLRVLN